MKVDTQTGPKAFNALENDKIIPDIEIDTLSREDEEETKNVISHQVKTNMSKQNKSVNLSMSGGKSQSVGAPKSPSLSIISHDI
jgi:hypothetical protein